LTSLLWVASFDEPLTFLAACHHVFLNFGYTSVSVYLHDDKIMIDSHDIAIAYKYIYPC